mmetsp:Transcript_1961/g.2898  ORF Transcript_1961/g.2898 Transcript_1961/m.2898 type:complete len:340 (+) Transcript_1961:2323-3342(+)
MENETETDCLILQSQAVKEIIEEAGNNLLQQASVDAFGDKVLEFINQSSKRVEENTKYKEENQEDEDGLDEEDIQVIKEENKNEQELQVTLAELFGAVFKTHRELSRPLAEKLLTVVLPKYGKDNASKHDMKLLLFVLDDMVEFLGPDFLGPVYPQICQQICNYASSKFAPIRQAAVYGIGMIAQHGGAAFPGVSGICLQGIQTAVEYQADAQTKGKKSKLTQFHHARENAIAALGKVLKYQSVIPEAPALVPKWLQSLPLTHDLEEAQIQNEFLATSMLKAPAAILGADNSGFEQVVVILGEICQKKQSNAETMEKLSVLVANLSQDAALGETFKGLC